MFRFISLLITILTVRLVLFYFFPPHEQLIRKNPIQQATIFSSIKAKIKSTYNKNLSGEESGLLMGIVFGDKDLDKFSIKKFQKTGVLHVVAASGMNVSMLTSFLLGGLVVFLRRQHALVITAAAILFYTALADFQPSIIRAALMSLFALGAGILGRQNTSLLALFFAAFAMVFWDPTVLVSISFILSFAATLGIIILDPIFKHGFFKSSLFEDFRTTLSAQIATTPILLFFFGNYSPVSILVNLLVLWTIPPLMLLGFMASILTFVTPLLAAPFIRISMPLLIYFRIIVDFFAKYSLQFKLEFIPWTLIAGYYLILAAGIAWLKKRKTISN